MLANLCFLLFIWWWSHLRTQKGRERKIFPHKDQRDPCLSNHGSQPVRCDLKVMGHYQRRVNDTK